MIGTNPWPAQGIKTLDLGKPSKNEKNEKKPLPAWALSAPPSINPVAARSKTASLWTSQPSLMSEEWQLRRPEAPIFGRPPRKQKWGKEKKKKKKREQLPNDIAICCMVMYPMANEIGDIYNL
jgi:hypothetical protein